MKHGCNNILISIGYIKIENPKNGKKPILKQVGFFYKLILDMLSIPNGSLISKKEIFIKNQVA